MIVEPVQLVARGLDDGAGWTSSEISCSPLTGPELAGGLDDDLREVARLARHDAADVGAREQQQVGDQPAHALRGAQRRARGVALVAVQRFGEQLEVGEHARQRRAQLVRGVGDELALAREHRLGLAARGVELAEHALERARQLGDLVVGLRLGHAARGVARARDLRGGRWSARRSAPSRGARSPCPASSASAVPASTPSSRNSSTRATVASVSETRRAVLDDHARRSGSPLDGGTIAGPADHAVAVRPSAARLRGRRATGALRGSCGDHAAAEREDPDRRRASAGRRSRRAAVRS